MPRTAAAAALAAAVAVCAGCARAVPVHPAPQAGAPPCEAAARAWPAQVAGRDRVETDPAAPAVAAWGDPAVIARCGVTSPGPSTRECLQVDGVDWIVEPLSDGTAFTTYGRSPAIEVLVPTAYTPAPLQLPAFTAAARAIPQGPHRCR